MQKLPKTQVITTTVAEHHQNGGDSNGIPPITNGGTATGQSAAIARCTYSGCTYGHAEYDLSSPSPMKWDFIASGDGDPNKNQSAYQTHPGIETTSSSSKSQYTQQYRGPQGAANVNGNGNSGGCGKTVSIWQTATGTSAAEANAIIYHHESGMVENCCENYAFSGDYGGSMDDGAGDGSDAIADTEVSVSEAELSAFFDKQLQRQQQHEEQQLRDQQLAASAPKLNNTTAPNGVAGGGGAAVAHGGTGGSADIVLSRRNNIAAAINRLNLSPDFRHYEKITNLSQQQACNLTPNRFPSIGAGGLNVYNANYCYNEAAAAARADKFATAEGSAANATATPASTADTFELFNISGGGGAAATVSSLAGGAGGAQRADGRTASAGISLTTQNVFETSVVQPLATAVRRFSAVDAVAEQPPSADLLFYDLSDEHTIAATWATTGGTAAAAGADGDGLPLQQRQRRRFQASANDEDNGGGGGEVSAYDAIVIGGGGGGGASGTPGGLRGLFRNVRRRARQYKEFMQGDR